MKMTAEQKKINAVFNTNFHNVRDSLVSMISCEIRAALYQRLVNEMGHQQALSVLLQAEKVAKSKCNKLRLSDLLH